MKKMYQDKLGIGLCIIALVGFFLPAVVLIVDFLGNSYSQSFSLAALFSQSRGAGTDFFSGLGESPLGELLSGIGNDSIDQMMRALLMSVGAYLIAAVLVVLALAVQLLGRFKKIGAAVTGLALGLLVFAAIRILGVPGLAAAALEESLGFFASLLDVSRLLHLRLGYGMLLSIAALGCALVVQVVYWKD